MTRPVSEAQGARPAVFTIRPGLSFVDALAGGLKARLGEQPEAVARALVLLPTRRACRSLREAFLRASAGRAALLPRLVPLGDVDEDEIALAGADTESFSDLEVPPAISRLERELVLARLVRARADRPTTPDQAVRLARELARLVDQVHTERLGFERLAGLAPETLAQHWQETLRFLAIVTKAWPKILDELGRVDPARRRNLLLEAEARLWRAQPPAHPVVAAGSTGSIPATADLLQVVAGLAAGAVVLPGLDREMDEAAWRRLQPSHPQWGMARLIERLGVARAEVRDWPAGSAAGEASARARLVSIALRPAAAPPARPRDLDVAAALQGASLAECASPEQEAGAIALVMRETLETTQRTAALVTPDRALARRVAAELSRFGVAVDDSAGAPLAETPPGAYLRLLARLVADELAPVPLLALFKHPLAAGGMAPAAFRAAARRLEVAALRGPRPGAGFAGLRRAVEGKDAGLGGFLDRIEQAILPLALALAAPALGLGEALAAHVAAAETLAATDADGGAERLWAGEAGEALAAFVAELAECAASLGPLAGADYPALFESLLETRVVRPRFGRHPRLAIWGLLEARLQDAEVLILGGLNEGTWPAEAAPSPWMSRPMLARFGLPEPERRIGLAAHDFQQAFSAPHVVLTRALRVEGTPTVPSRWLLRVETAARVLGAEDAFAAARRAGGQWLHWQRLLDRPQAFARPERPAPCPPLAARPRELSVTQIEMWMRDPYAVYARHVLRLAALDPIDADPGAADYGSFIHAALDSFLKDTPAALPEDAVERLLAKGRERLAGLLDRPGVRAFWWPRFERIAGWFVAEERERRKWVRATASEVRGRLVIAAPAGPFVVRAKADRIDVQADGTLAIVDYKTGAPPSPKEVRAGFAPQLPLEAAIAEACGFDGVPAAPVGVLEYWRLRGTEPAGERRAFADAGQLARDARAGLARLVAAFDLETTPYRAQPRPSAAPRFNDYEHLARVKEWATAADEGEG